MAQITLGDLTGSSQIDTSDQSLAGKSQLTALTTGTSELLAALPKPLTDPTFTDARFSAAFDKPTIPLEGNTVDVQASVNSTVSVARSADSPLLGDDDYDPVVINANECWVSFELDTSLSGSVEVPLPDGFGVNFTVSSAPTFATYLLIPADRAPETTLSQGISQILDAFSILDSSADILSIAPDVIYTSDISGVVKIGGSWSLPLSVNQLSLADASLPFDSSISVNPAVSVGVKGDISLTSEFSVRFRRSAANLLRLGLYKKKGTTFDVSFTSSAGLGVNSGQTDLIDEFLTAVGPGVDFSSLQPGDSANFQQVLNDSLYRSLAFSLNAACSAAYSDEAAIVYEIDTSAGDRATADAIASALTGNWVGISQLPNARKIRNVITDTVETKFAVTVNVLGLYNYRSVADFVRSMKVVTNRDDGSVVITDSATATHIVTASTPLAADPDRLRAALYEAFVATATYKALLTGTGVNPVFGATQDYFLYKDSMPYRAALTQLNTGEVLGVMQPAVKTGQTDPGGAIRHARFVASCKYGNDDVLRFFFSDISGFKPRKTVDLEKIGRTVLASLLDLQNPIDRKRYLMLNDDAAWAQLDATGSNIPDPYYSDWYDITVAWAPAIAKVGPLLADIIAYAKTVAGDPTADPVFMKKRAAVALALDGATHKTHASANPNFPICVMATLAGLTPGENPPVFQASWNGATVFDNKPAEQLAMASPAS